MRKGAALLTTAIGVVLIVGSPFYGQAVRDSALADRVSAQDAGSLGLTAAVFAVILGFVVLLIALAIMATTRRSAAR